MFSDEIKTFLEHPLSPPPALPSKFSRNASDLLEISSIKRAENYSFCFCVFSRLMEDHGAEIRDLEQRYQDLQNELRDREDEVKALHEDVSEQKEKNARAPTTTMKNMVERLKTQLSLKEKQQQVCGEVCVWGRGSLSACSHAVYFGRARL